METDNLTLSDYLAVVRQRLVLIVGVAIIITGAAVLISLSQPKLYSASAKVAVSTPPELPNSSGGGGGASNNPLAQQRFAQTQALLAQTPSVARAALKAAHVTTLTPQRLLDEADVSADPNADLLTFRVDSHDRNQAARLATAYATAYVNFARARNDAAVKTLQKHYQAQADEANTILKAGTAPSRVLRAMFTQLKTAQRNLDALSAFQEQVKGSWLLASAADSASQVQPQTKRNIILGAGIGLLLGLLLAFIYDAVDSRVRSAQELTAGLPLAVLGRIPRPSRAIRQRNELVMLAERDSPHAEAFRALRARIDFANSDRAHVIMVTSAVEREGKSTTVSNLAAAFAEAGRHVVLVDLDVARASVHRFFGLGRGPGVSDIVAGESDLRSALATIDLHGGGAPSTNGGSRPNGGSRRNGRGGGSLRVLPVGDAPLDPIAVLTSQKLLEILRTLRAESELVLIDAAPLLPVSDGVILSSNVDAVLAIAHAGMLRRSIVEEFDVVLDSIPAAKLGLVLTGVPRADTYGYPRYGAKPQPAAAGASAEPPASRAPQPQKGR